MHYMTEDIQQQAFQYQKRNNPIRITQRTEKKAMKQKYHKSRTMMEINIMNKLKTNKRLYINIYNNIYHTRFNDPLFSQYSYEYLHNQPHIQCSILDSPSNILLYKINNVEVLIRKYL
ncbi:hypothetical protein EDEG_01970 [Edhazardia aedis USNM 41457]|uniref:Uncharacterized protein n=1 Tax=Edhazardia aedis (strain USNM 41457) TaxID=1003232 RepID=J9DQX8_EDHAE|nr:hypothetical protein EDEG_01970 [Edhazardia aedis USNM 41457]|eukprot:EJW03732.1 hypothetical protein EDEG_01970 [Edhazardia aedis USNM 41457]